MMMSINSPLRFIGRMASPWIQARMRRPAMILSVFTVMCPCALLKADTNIAPSGTGYAWSRLTSSTANTARVAKAGINDNNLTTNVDITTGDNARAWEAGGVVWTSGKTISSVRFINGDITSGHDGMFEANVKLQFTADGTTWTDSGWPLSPAYPNNSTAGGKAYTFSGKAVSGKLGARVVGQVRTIGHSYYWRVKEIQIFDTGSVTSYTIASNAGANGTISPSGKIIVLKDGSQTFTVTPNSGYAVENVLVNGVSKGPITSYSFTNVQANGTILANFKASTSELDSFGLRKVHPSVGREWFNVWDTGPERTNTWGMLSTDPGLVIRGNTSATIQGASGSRAGQMKVSGKNPRIYIRDSDTEAIPPASSVQMWNNVEVTFYATSNLNSGVGWAGLEAVVKTNHLPDSWDCESRGYGGRMLFDGRIDLEKEVSHTSNINVQQDLATWPGGLPLNRWIGYKIVARNCDNNTHVKLELYRELSLGNETNPIAPAGGGNWELLGTYIDTGTWSAGHGNATPKCSFDTGKTDRSLPLTWANWSVYLRTDDDNNKGLVQHYKWLSVREIAPLP